VFIQSFVLMAGGFLAPWVRKITPRAALLAHWQAFPSPYLHAAGARYVYDASDRHRVLRNPAGELVGGVRYYKGIPAGLVAIAVGSAIAWGQLH